MRINSILTIFIIFVMGLFITETAFAYPSIANLQKKYSQPRQIVHTVQKNESIWSIAERFNMDPARLAEINGLDNPDLIFPGNKLTIRIQVDGSILVLDKEEPVDVISSGNLQPLEAVAHITYPDKNDIFSPENPVVSYEFPETVLKSQGKPLQEPLVFKTFEKFVKWLSASLGYPSDMTQARSQASFDPPTSPTYLSSNSFFGNNLPLNGDVVFFIDNFSSYITGITSPPPKSL
jgi:LysM repeat protein